MTLTIEKREVEPGVIVLEITGRIAPSRDSRKIEPEVEGAVAAGAKKIILDLSGVTHIDSTGIGVMASCFGKARQGGAELSITGAKESVFEVFQITRLVRVVAFYPDVDSALKGNGRLV